MFGKKGYEFQGYISISPVLKAETKICREIRDIQLASTWQSAVTSGTSEEELCSMRHTRGQAWPRKEGAWCNPNKRCKIYHRSYDNDAEKTTTKKLNETLPRVENSTN